jgi:putative phosphoesterase
MKLMFASDLHGSLFYCNKMFELYHEENADKLILLGDLLYHGARNDLTLDYDTIKVAELLNKSREDILAVHGNCDSDVDQDVLQFPIGSDYLIFYPEDIKKIFFLTHGHIYNKNNLPKLKKDFILIHGHTHIPTIDVDKISNIIYLNPGSISCPKQNNPNTYMIYEHNQFEIKDINKNLINKLKLVEINK